MKNLVRSEIVRISGTLRRFCAERGLSYCRMSKVLNGHLPPNSRERLELALLLRRATREELQGLNPKEQGNG
ncbi:MAG: hypothetical protein AB1424_05105 [Thermodesulfobacteriota bacterium]